MWKLLLIELKKIFSRPRTYIGFIAITALVVLVQTLFYSQGKEFIQVLLKQVDYSGFEVQGKVINGFWVCFVILFFLIIHVPLLVAFVAGDAISGEANMGTLRLLLTKPVSREKLMLSKFLACSVYSMMLLVWLAVMALFGSIAIFGESDMLVLAEKKVVLLFSDDVMWRYACAFAMAALAMLTVTALAFLLSIFADNSIGPIVATMSIVVLSTIISKLQFPIIEKLKYGLFTYHMEAWTRFFDDPVNYQEIVLSVIILIVHIILFVGAALFIFKRKDILS